MSGTVQDVTVLRQAEAEVRRLNEELEERVEQRTRELHDAQAELIKKERLATLGQLTATVSHELRNPLGAMRTSAYVLSKSIPEGYEAAQKAVIRIDRGITRCDKIIDELLDFTRSTEIDREAVMVDSWLKAVLSELAIPGGVKLKTDLRLGNLSAMLDSGRMRRAIINIVENACQAIAGQTGRNEEAGEGIVKISTSKVNGKIEFHIDDNGPGIPADIREKIFEPLFSTKNFGVGLGLPTVRHILNQHGGSVTLKSKPGVGTLFRLSFPLEEPEAGQQSTVGNCFPLGAVGS
jgi:signal transduction histidine kinase